MRNKALSFGRNKNPVPLRRVLFFYFECLQLANASSDVYVKEALTELASDFKAMAEDLEQRNER
jgi:hypothetical protein